MWGSENFFVVIGDNVRLKIPQDWRQKSLTSCPETDMSRFGVLIFNVKSKQILWHLIFFLASETVSFGVREATWKVLLFSACWSGSNLDQVSIKATTILWPALPPQVLTYCTVLMATRLILTPRVKRCQQLRSAWQRCGDLKLNDYGIQNFDYTLKIAGDWNLIEYHTSFDGKPIPPHTPYLCPEARMSFEPRGSMVNISQVRLLTNCSSHIPQNVAHLSCLWSGPRSSRTWLSGSNTHENQECSSMKKTCVSYLCINIHKISLIIQWPYSCPLDHQSDGT